MSLSVQLSDDLVRSAQIEVKTSERSIAGQIEHWAKLGCAVESALKQPEIIAVNRGGGNHRQTFPRVTQQEQVQLTLETMATSADRSPIQQLLAKKTTPTYGTDPAYPGLIVRFDPDGSKTAGHFINRQFVAAQ
jgi:hypothetical protein